MDAPTCNIDLKGRRHRTKVYKACLKVAVLLSSVHAGLAYLQITSLVVFKVLWGLTFLAFSGFAVTREEVVNNVCIVVGALGKEETQSMEWKVIQDAKRVAALRARSIRIVLKGLLIAAALSSVALGAPYVFCPCPLQSN